MGKGDRRHSQKSIQRAGQRKKKARAAKTLAERAARFASVGKAAEKKTRTRKPSAAAPSA